ncbi:MAG TPA: metal-dependent hydrolase [Gammaproteobacteria bacterium]|nr:metal-dependent hydrolase [Gammaproteobacteria bacterium]
MDTITHSLLGAVVVRAVFPAGKSTHALTDRQRMLAGAVAGAFPDIDYVMSWVDPMVYLTLWHRSITHSFIVLPFWALLVGVTLAFIFHRRDEWRFVSLLAAFAVVSHILGDLVTVYGTQILAPLSGWRASIGTTFVIDPWFTLIVLVGVVAGIRKQGSTVPVISLAVLGAYLVFQANLRQQALAIAGAHMGQGNAADVHLAALPQPFSPFNWKIIASRGDRYDVTYVNLAGGYRNAGEGEGFWARVKRTYRSPDDLAWTRYYRFGEDALAAGRISRLWGNSQLDYFRRFAGFPVLYRVDVKGPKTCVWFTDLRYVLPYMTPPFRYGLCRAGDGSTWQLNRLRGG